MAECEIPSAVGVACRSCKSAELVWLGRKTGKFAPREFDFYQCRSCTLISVFPFIGFEIYNDAYYRGEGPDPFVDYASEYANYRATDRLVELCDLRHIACEYVEKVLPDCETLSWLDFGCGAGGLLKYLRDSGPLQISGRKVPVKLTGADVGPYAERLKEQDHFCIVDAERILESSIASFDVISIIEVIEHLPDPGKTVQSLARLLKPGGLLLLTTGNLDSWFARKMGLNFGYCVPEIHISLFNPRALEDLYWRSGLEPHYVRYHGVVEFKSIKTVRHPAAKRLVRMALRFPGVSRMIDTVYGVSVMPCGVKPQTATD